MNSIGLLQKKIETMRKEIINTAFKHWITSPKTLHISQELEKLLENWLFFVGKFPNFISLAFSKHSFSYILRSYQRLSIIKQTTTLDYSKRFLQ
ncbi:aspartyl-phosphate phosphatase Spo0E family protein [Brevibacterium sp. PAMC21349]|nr:aspartyl-phosphate phosphatase Spo0E family protein [Brevibacterium sp. PAMC21349]